MAVTSRVTGLLQQGIAAAKTGRKETARRLLTQVVEQDERNLTAWIWLSGVVESLDDKQVCLENVLALEPGNDAAQTGLDWVLEQKNAPVYVPPLISESQSRRTAKPLSPAAAMFYGEPGEPEPKLEPEPQTFVPLRPDEDSPEELAPDQVEAMHEFDNEYLCPYCAAPTLPDDKKCKTCKSVMWKSSRRSPEGSYWFWILIGFLWISAIWRVYMFGWQLFLKFSSLFAEGKIETLEQFVGIYLGWPSVPPDVAAAIKSKLSPLDFWMFAISIVIQLAILLLIYIRWRPIYWIGVGLGALNLVYSLIQAAMNPSWASLLVVGIALLPVLILVMVQDDFLQKRERQLCGPDPGLRSHSEFYMRGREYARKGMWTQAVVHYRRAAGGAPTMLAYHLELAKAYVKLKRYERARSALREAQRLGPNDPGIQGLVSLLATMEPGKKRHTK